MDNKPYSHFDYLTSLFTESPKYFYSDCIAELWATIPEKVYEENEPFWLIRDNHKKQIEDAIINGELEGIIEERIEGSKDDGFQEITDKNRIRKIEKGRLGNNYVVFTVYHDKFKDWLIKSNQWPLADDCLLNKWFEGEQQTETVHAAEMANQAVLEESTEANRNVKTNSWLIVNPKDPQPEQPWYTPARYFARALVKEDVTLLTKRNLLASKVAKSLDRVGIKKRGGVKSFDPNTIKKAFRNINFT